MTLEVSAVPLVGRPIRHSLHLFRKRYSSNAATAVLPVSKCLGRREEQTVDATDLAPELQKPLNPRPSVDT